MILDTNKPKPKVSVFVVYNSSQPGIEQLLQEWNHISLQFKDLNTKYGGNAIDVFSIDVNQPGYDKKYPELTSIVTNNKNLNCIFAWDYSNGVYKTAKSSKDLPDLITWINNLADPQPTQAIIYFYSPTCPACTAFKPEWDLLVSSLNTYNKSHKNIDIIEVNTTDSTQTAPFQSIMHLVTTIPFITLYAYKVKTYLPYNGNRNNKDMYNWIIQKIGSENTSTPPTTTTTAPTLPPVSVTVKDPIQTVTAAAVKITDPIRTLILK